MSENEIRLKELLHKIYSAVTIDHIHEPAAMEKAVSKIDTDIRGLLLYDL